MTTADTAHLLRRTGFAEKLSTIEALASMDRAALVDQILDFSPNPAPDYDPNAKAEEWENLQALREWWLNRMATVPRPLQERLTLFWHNHFATSITKIFDADHMYRQNAIFRSKGAGDMNELFKAVSTDPAMLFWLDGAYSGKWGPNENFGRELQELFLLGVDNGYFEPDVKAMARAWTGHSVDSTKDDTYLYRPDWHDTNQKTLYNVTENWNGPDVLEQILVSPGRLNVVRKNASEHLAAKLWSWFAYPIKRTDALAVTLGASLAADPKMNVKAFLRVMFNMDEFYTDTAKQGLVRHPIDWAAAMMRTTGIPAAKVSMVGQLEDLGMGPLTPPNVSGWRQNRAWMSVSAYWRRAEIASSLFGAAIADPASGGTSFLNTIDAMTPTAAVDEALRQLGENRIVVGSVTYNALVALVSAERAANAGANQRRNLARTIAISPEFSLA
jgi:uncharacterized protein (DUF1800 family)